MQPFASSFEPLESRRMLSVEPGIDGVAVLGDSYSDEYQIYADARATARNWVEQLADDSNVSFGAFSATDPLGPVNAGYGFNFAVSGATSADMIAGGQHTGAAAQAATGDVDLATVFVGGNDFRNVFNVLFTQGLPAAIAALQATVPAVISNIGTATGTILSPTVLSANPDVNVVLTTIPKISRLPQVRGLLLQFPNLQPFVDAVDAAVGVVNQGIGTVAASGGGRVAVADFHGLIESLFDADIVEVGYVVMDMDAILNPTNDPTQFMLGDLFHAGTVAQGLLGNLLAETANSAFGTKITRLSSHDILENAGLKKDPSAGAAAAGRLFSDVAIADDEEVDEELLAGASDESQLA